MTKTEIRLEGYQNGTIYVRQWVPDGPIKAGLHILHGMAEHSLRYDEFATYLNRQGIVVWANDHRQHGYSISHDDVGILNKSDQWYSIIEDVAVVQREFYKMYGDVPMFMLGHSMGSLILRCYLQNNQTDLKGAIVMGSPAYTEMLAKTGVIASKMLDYFKPKKRSDFLDNLSVGAFNKSVKEPKTPYDWISKDSKIVEKYAKDSLCGYSYNPRFYGELSHGLIEANTAKHMKAFPKINMLMISGKEDPAGRYGKGVIKISEKYKTLGVSNKLVLIENMRHEILNEVNREETYQIVSSWIKACY